MRVSTDTHHTVIGLNLRRDDQTFAYGNLYWPPLDTLLSSLTVRKLVFGLRSREDVPRFVEEILDIKLPMTSTKFECKCAVWHHNKDENKHDNVLEDFFVPADTEADTSQSSSFSHLSSTADCVFSP